MKSKFFILFMVIGFLTIFPSFSADSYREEKVKIYNDTTGKIYYNQTEIINDVSSPVKINKLVAKHIPTSTAQLADIYYDTLYRYLDDEQKITLQKYRNENLEISIDAEGTNAVAVKFGVVVYDAFDEYLGGLTAITMDPPTKGMLWDYSPSYLFKIEKYGIVCVYVRQVRLSSGEIWNFKPQLVVEELSKRVAGISSEDLQVVD